ncbi:hypothetical protein D9M70_559220 [compost metagenome]
MVARVFAVRANARVPVRPRTTTLQPKLPKCWLPVPRYSIRSGKVLAKPPQPT